MSVPKPTKQASQPEVTDRGQGLPSLPHVPSIHDREHHRTMIRGILGEDLWLRKDGHPRQRMADQHVAKLVSDGQHVVAHAAMDSLYRFLPRSMRGRGGDGRWVDYGVVGEGSMHVGYRKEYPEWLDGQRCQPLGRSHLLNHVFLVRSVLPNFRQQDEFDCLLIDVDVELHGWREDLFTIPAEWRVAMLAPWVAAAADLGLHPLCMLSGSRGFWVQLFWDGPTSREETRVVFDAVCRGAGAEIDRESGQWGMTVGEISYRVDEGSLSPNVCRLPWSLKEGYDNVSVHVSAESGEVDLLALLDLPISDVSGIVASDAPVESEAFPPVADSRDWLSGIWADDCVETTGAAVGGSEPTESTPSPVPEGVDGNPLPPSHNNCGVVCQESGAESASLGSLEHLRWTWQDVIAEAEGVTSIGRPTDWRDLVLTDVPDGEKWILLVRGGNIARVSARMKHQLGHVNWEALAAEYARHYDGSDQSKGGTIARWIEDWRERTHGGETIVPRRSGLTAADVARCRAHAHAVVAAVPGRARRPAEDDVFHVLLVLLRVDGGRGGFEASEDFLARRAGLNPFPTWEEQAATEGGVIADPDDETRHVRHNPTSVNARKRLVRVMRLLCDMTPGTTTGQFPYRRTAIGENRWSDERVQEKGRAVGSTYERVPGHRFWGGA